MKARPRCCMCRQIATWTYWGDTIPPEYLPAYFCTAHSRNAKKALFEPRYFGRYEFRRVSDGPSTRYPPSTPKEAR